MNIWMILIIVMILSALVQSTLQSRFNKYSQVGLPNGMTGAQVAQKMLQDHGIYDVKVVPARGMLTDHFNPQTKTVALSEGVYGSRSVAAAAVAAHECGHAVQHALGYAPLRLRSALVPVVNFASNIVQWVLHQHLPGTPLVRHYSVRIDYIIQFCHPSGGSQRKQQSHIMADPDRNN